MVKIIYHQKDYPIFQNRMYGSREDGLNCPKGDICLIEDEKTGLIYNHAFNAEFMHYDKQYQNEQGVSQVFRRHLKDVAKIIDRTIGRTSLVEVGCGKGFFLEYILNLGFNVVGFDPTYEGINPKIYKEYFTSQSVNDANGLILRHVLEHIQSPVEFLERLRRANGGSGKIYIEVPCLDWISEHNAWFDIFYEHVNYFRLSDFRRMFGKIYESGKIFGGQYIYLVAELSSLRNPIYSRSDSFTFPPVFGQQINAPVISLNGKVAIWGGASKGVIFALLKSRAGHNVDLVIDINPAKQGKYLPGTGLQVYSPESALTKLPEGSVIYVMNSNYLAEIRRMSNNAYQYIGIDNE